MKKHSNSGKIAVIALLWVLIAGGTYSLLNMDKLFIKSETDQLSALNVVYNNIYVRGEAVGGLTKEQAVKVTNDVINNSYAADKKLDFSLAEGTYHKSFTYPELGMRFNVESAVDEAYAVGRTEDGKTKRGAVNELEMGGKYYDAENTFDKEDVKKCLSAMESDVNAILKPLGKTMDVDRTADAASQMLMVNEYDTLIIIATK